MSAVHVNTSSVRVSLFVWCTALQYYLLLLALLSISQVIWFYLTLSAANSLAHFLAVLLFQTCAILIVYSFPVVDW